MARIVVGSYMVRYPMGGVLSSSLQWLIGFRRLGHDVYFVEKSGWPNSCYDPTTDTMSDDCSYGTQAVHTLLSRHGLEKQWCFVDAAGQYHGLTRPQIEQVFSSADLFVDRGTHGAWREEAGSARIRAYIDGEPAFRQMQMETDRATAESLDGYDFYFTTGRNVGTARSTAPSAGKTWWPLFHPVSIDLFRAGPVDSGAPFTTVMKWQSHAPVTFGGVAYGHKDVEFERFVGLPRATQVPLELALSGRAPVDRLRSYGWRVRVGHDVTKSFDSYAAYLAGSRGELSICKHGFVATRSGWFSDRSAAYLASWRPVVMQDTGFSDHLPCGEGLFAFRTVEDVVAALEQVESDYEHHSRRAREIAAEYLDAPRVLRGLLETVSLE